jgi:hypothetical protein
VNVGKRMYDWPEASSDDWGDVGPLVCRGRLLVDGWPGSSRLPEVQSVMVVERQADAKEAFDARVKYLVGTKYLRGL